MVRQLFPDYPAEYARRGWQMLTDNDRVYVNSRARADLGWASRYDFRSILERLQRNEAVFSPLAQVIGSKGYHDKHFEDGPYPVEHTGSHEQGINRLS